MSLEKVYSEGQLNVGYTDEKATTLSGMDLKDRAFANKISNDKLVDIKEISYFITKTKDVDLANSKYRISIYDKNTEDELPGNILFSKDLTFEKEGWNKLSISNVQVNGDYYIAFTKLDGEIAFGMDDGKDGINSFQMFNGAWDEPETKGTYMIGAKVNTLSDKEVKQVTISFDKNGGSGEMQAVKVKANEDYKLPECTFTAPDNQEFDAWQVNNERKNVSDTIKADKDLTIKALWKDKKNENPQEEKLDPIMPNPPLMTTNVTDFTHFISYSNDNKSDEYLKSVQKVIVNHKGNISEITDVKGIDSTDFLSNPNKKLQFSFTEKLDKDDTITIVSSKYKNVVIKITMDNLVGNDVYYGISANIEGKKVVYKVTFDKNGGSGEMKDVEVENGGIFTVPQCTFTAPSGMEFDSWEYMNEKTEVGHQYQITKNITIKALWKEKLTKKATITFDNNGGLGTMKKVEKLVKEEYELPVCEFLAPKDMEFDCWEINGQRHLPGEKITLNEDITLKALWIKEDKSKEPKEPLLGEISSEDSSAMKVNCINSIGYKKEDSEYVNKINLITIRRNGKEIKHYLFTKEDGKYKNLDKTLDKVSIAFKDKTFFNRDDEIIISARGYKDLKLHIISADDNVMNALYITEIVSTVKFETFDGSKIDDQIIKVGLSSANKLAKVQDPTKDGYTFKGWYEDRELTKVFYFNKKIITDTTIFAKWVKNTPNTPSEEKNIELEVKNVTIHQHDTLDLKSLIVKAKDNKNNDLKEQVEIIDEGGFNKDKVGTYTITFKLTNKNVSVTKKATVTVVEKENSTVNPENPTNPTNPTNPGHEDPKTPNEKTQIKFLFGENQEIDNNKKKTLIFKLSPKVEDFEDVYVDDKLVDKSMYDVKKGSTIIEFKDEFIKQLSCKKHKFKFNFKEGSIETYILVKDSKEEQDKDRRNNPSLVKTSIQSASFMPLILSTIALVVVKRKRK
ncbi:InlB B-repeat-containing protein [uncultured Parvimonas sp.]|uniref:InlB B-repeat-containing protein n=1 Tax=uncultured Parvimonas sp. TaxID=747372 RepID=UPI002599BE85|nr:InlB B-repeat-containing protein [uncultured Parvimonas sp.]